MTDLEFFKLFRRGQVPLIVLLCKMKLKIIYFNCYRRSSNPRNIFAAQIIKTYFTTITLREQGRRQW